MLLNNAGATTRAKVKWPYQRLWFMKWTIACATSVYISRREMMMQMIVDKMHGDIDILDLLLLLEDEVCAERKMQKYNVFLFTRHL